MHEDDQMRNAACQALAQGLGRRAVFLDVGAMDGPQSPAFRYLAKHQLIDYVGIEPQESECEKLRRMFPGGRFLPVAVGDREGPAPLHITLSPACISVLPPNEAVLADYPIGTCFEVKRQAQIELTTIARLVETGQMPVPDYIKCDAQGFDYEVLLGCGALLDQVLAIEVECQFKPIYQGQKLFGDIKQLLESHGFILRDLRHQGAFEYEVVEVNAYFSKRPHEIGDRLQALKLWEFATPISSPLSFAQLKRANPKEAIFRRVTPAMDKTVIFS